MSSLGVDRVAERRISGATAVEGEEEIIAGTPATRRAMIATAMGGIDRFKKSWVSVMLLKSSIGLGQVVVLVTLLVLASTLKSPLAPYATQSTASPACPHPELFQAWMAVNMARLAICWCVSCWMCVRYNRDRTQRQDEERPGSPHSSHIPHSDTMPSLTHSSSTGSSTTLPGLCSSQSTPETAYTSAMGSQLSLDAMVGYATDYKGRHPSSDPAITSVVPASPSTPTLGSDGSPASDNDLQAARDLHDGRQLPDSLPSSESSTLATLLDKIAPSISKSLGAISAVLFILGNILLFYPSPAKEQTCYHAAPMLWWGVMTVVGIGWILFAQIFIVIVVVGLGGQAVLAVFRRIGIITPPPEPEPPRPAQPDVLTPAELENIPLVIYLPDPLETTNEIVPAVDPSRLSHPPVYLPSHKATCAICQEAFEPPAEARAIMLKAEPLRLLGCGHVYHTGCIDQWLLQGHGNCPFCNRSVRDMLKAGQAG